MTTDFIHIKTPSIDCVVRISFISFAKRDNDGILVYLTGDRVPLSVAGEQADILWRVLRDSSLSI